MSDLFISYSRKDREFLQRLNQALVTRQRDVWIDLDDILPTEEWFAKIKSGIAAANNFVFIISPDSVASKVCSNEVKAAIENHKRIIPVLYRDVAIENVPPELAALNWLSFKKDDDFEHGVEALLRAIDVDPDWVNAHTRLQVRALEWEKGGHDKSLLLRGSDLKDAERSLVDHADREPTPTPLQSRYVLGSREAEKRWLRLLVGAIGFGFVVAVALAIIAFQQYQNATERLKVATARELATHSLNQLGGRRDLALLVGIEATRPIDTLEARSGLLAALQADPKVVVYLHGHSGPVTSVAFSPDGKTMASGAADGTIRFWDVAGHKPVGEPLSIDIANVDSVEEVRALVFNPDGRSLAFGSFNGVFGILDTESHKPIGEMSTLGGSVDPVAFSPNGEVLAVNAANFSLYDFPSLKRIGKPIQGLDAEWSPSFDTQQPDAVIATADGKLFAFNRRESIWIWDATAGKPLAGPFVGSTQWLTRLVFSPDETTLAGRPGRCHPPLGLEDREADRRAVARQCRLGS